MKNWIVRSLIPGVAVILLPACQMDMGNNNVSPTGSSETDQPERTVPIKLRDGTTRQIPYEVKGRVAVMEGDIVLGTNLEGVSLPLKKVTSNILNLSNRDKLWPDGIVPYVISLTNSTKIAWINAAIRDFNSRTSVQFVPRNTIYPSHSDFVNFIDDPVLCQSWVGRIGVGPQDIWVGSECQDASGVIHEMGHASGLFHEHQRTDRGGFISLTGNWSQDPANWSEDPNAMDFGRYDLNSIMHYDAGHYQYVFDKKTIDMTMSGANGNNINPFKTLSFGDVEGLRSLYPASHVMWPAFYFASYPATNAWLNGDQAAAVRHYRQYGIGEGRFSSPAFNIREYLKLYPTLANALGGGANFVGGTNHWQQFGITEGRQGSLGFNARYYFAKYPATEAWLGSTNFGGAARHFAEFGLIEGRQGSEVFNAPYYLQIHPALAQIIGTTNYLAAFVHWQQHGLFEGRVGSQDFNIQNYLNRYPALRDAFVNAGLNPYEEGVYHWINHGKAEGRIGT